MTVKTIITVYPCVRSTTLHSLTITNSHRTTQEHNKALDIISTMGSLCNYTHTHTHTRTHAHAHAHAHAHTHTHTRTLLLKSTFALSYHSCTAGFIVNQRRGVNKCGRLSLPIMSLLHKILPTGPVDSQASERRKPRL